MEAKATRDFRFSLASAMFSTACHHLDWLAKWRWLLAPSLEVGLIKLCSLSHWQYLLASSWTVKVPNQISSSLTSFTSYQVYPSTLPSFSKIPGNRFYRWPFPTNFTKSKTFRAEKIFTTMFYNYAVAALMSYDKLWDVSTLTTIVFNRGEVCIM